MRGRSTPSLYSLSCKTENTRKSFWNVYCSAANQMREGTTKVAAKPHSNVLPPSKTFLFIITLLLYFYWALCNSS